MVDVVDAARIKEIRGRYGFSQRSFAKVLGIGEATMVRYEKGDVPSKANANLIRAAEEPRFVQGCLEREGDSIPRTQRQKAERYIYSCIGLADSGLDAEKKEHPMDHMSEVYEYTLQQEVLTERAANIIGEIVGIQLSDGKRASNGISYETLRGRLSALKPTIADEENCNAASLSRISGYLDCAEEAVRVESLKAAS